MESPTGWVCCPGSRCVRWGRLGGRLTRYIPGSAHLLVPSHLHPTTISPHVLHNTTLSSPFEIFILCQIFRCTLGTSRFSMLVVELACRPNTMSSSHMTSSSTDQAAMYSTRLSSKDRRYQTVYDDGRSRCIVEARRRPGVARNTDSKDLEHFYARSSIDGRTMESPQRSSPSVQSSYPSLEVPSFKSEGLVLSRDKGLKPYHKSPRRVIIVPAASRPCISKSEGQASASQKWVEPTPPPTPRLGRRPTPELSDLDEAPFCECDQAIVVKCCAACKKMMGHAVY
jgi:hypothetical protein